MTSDGKPYAPAKYKDVTRERYIISKHSNTSYLDTGDVTPIERMYLLEFIAEELRKQKELIDKQRAKLKIGK